MEWTDRLTFSLFSVLRTGTLSQKQQKGRIPVSYPLEFCNSALSNSNRRMIPSWAELWLSSLRYGLKMNADTSKSRRGHQILNVEGQIPTRNTVSTLRTTKKVLLQTHKHLVKIMSLLWLLTVHSDLRLNKLTSLNYPYNSTAIQPTTINAVFQMKWLI